MAINPLSSTTQQTQQAQAQDTTTPLKHHHHHAHKPQTSTTTNLDTFQTNQDDTNATGTYTNPQYSNNK